MNQILLDIIDLTCILSFINSAITFPLIFNNFIVPKIEKKIGCKYIVTKGLQIIYPDFLCEWFQYVEISGYISIKYVLSKVARKPSEKIRLSSLIMLQAKNYKTEDSPKLEIFMSIFVWISFIWIFVSGYMLFYYNK